MNKIMISFIMLIVLSLTACAPDVAVTPVEVDTQDTEAPQVESTATSPVEVPPEPSPVPDPLVKNVAHIGDAVVRIEVDGDFSSPQFGDTSHQVSGSGFLIDPSGIAVTTSHLVSGASKINVFFNGDDQRYQADVVGFSECYDLAVIDIEGSGYPYLGWGESTAEAGDDIFAVGYPLGSIESVDTEGAIFRKMAGYHSSIAEVDLVFEHTAQNDHGMMGGALVAKDASIAGMLYPLSTWYTNQQYALSSPTLKEVAEALVSGEKPYQPGINGSAFVVEDGSLSGIWVSAVAPGSLAAGAGMRAGDILLELDGIPLAGDGSMEDYCRILRSHMQGDMVSVKALRWETNEIFEGQLGDSTLALSVTGDSSEEELTLPQSMYFVEEFDQEINGWRSFVNLGEKNYLDIVQQDGKMLFDIQGHNVWSYLIYEGATYKDVRVDLVTENRASYTNRMGAVCRYDEDLGWYEFNIRSDGLYRVRRYQKENDFYLSLCYGGSEDIRMKWDTNQITATCIGNEVALLVNGVDTCRVEDRYHRMGQVGLTIQSLGVHPVKVEVDSFAVSRP
jgi:S1-C subfamily serine protease